VVQGAAFSDGGYGILEKFSILFSFRTTFPDSFRITYNNPFSLLKTFCMRKYLFQSMIVLAAAALWTGCDKDDDDSSQYTLSGPASGTQERPNPVTTPATGNITGTYNKDTKVLDYTITWNGLTADPFAAHFHGPAGPEEIASPVVTIENFPMTASGTISDRDTLTAEMENQLLGGKWYYNIHTTTNPGGEIRGQVTASPQ
jgi:hypothetical protein